MTQRSTVHATFCIEKLYDASPARVFKAFADRSAKDHWFEGPGDWNREERSMDFRVGGREVWVGGPPGQPAHGFWCLYQDIIPNERIVYTYDMKIGDNRISVSLATIELKPEGAKTRLTLTEQGVFLDGYDDAGSREHGTNWLLDKLGETLKD
jgi:uncharacterized protein YndB with AHSA1/START domain